MTDKDVKEIRNKTINALTLWLSSIFENQDISFFETEGTYQLFLNGTGLSTITVETIDQIQSFAAYTTNPETSVSLAFVTLGHKCILNTRVALNIQNGMSQEDALADAFQFAFSEYKKLVKSCPELIDDVNEAERISDESKTKQIMDGWRDYVKDEAAKMTPKIFVSRTRDVKLPQRGTTGSAGLDFFVPNDRASETIQPGDKTFIPSGIKANVPDGHALIAFNKSGVALKKGLMVGACVVDSDYQGEIHLHLVNTGNQAVTIEAGEKLVQFLLIPVAHDPVEEVPEDELFLSNTERGVGGFGSTGIQ